MQNIVNKPFHRNRSCENTFIIQTLVYNANSKDKFLEQLEGCDATERKTGSTGTLHRDLSLVRICESGLLRHAQERQPVLLRIHGWESVTRSRGRAELAHGQNNRKAKTLTN